MSVVGCQALVNGATLYVASSRWLHAGIMATVGETQGLHHAVRAIERSALIRLKTVYVAARYVHIRKSVHDPMGHRASHAWTVGWYEDCQVGQRTVSCQCDSLLIFHLTMFLYTAWQSFMHIWKCFDPDHLLAYFITNMI